MVRRHAGRYADVLGRPRAESRFRETDRPIPHYDGHHVQVYVADFSGPHRQLQEKGLISEESDQHQYRFKDIVDPETGAPLFTIEHEVRSMRHPLYHAAAGESQSRAEQHELYAGPRRVDLAATRAESIDGGGDGR